MLGCYHPVLKKTLFEHSWKIMSRSEILENVLGMQPKQLKTEVSVFGGSLKGYGGHCHEIGNDGTTIISAGQSY